ncbi:Nudix [Glarea lozoyensis ATCC 20868]|uniref:Nudix n=2 Tax=Glarea lozoyensis TaxID=101852 RepID=S3CMG5_GLAL2|nr:Nudix [Glarea lozoyensis ATCC 20868]EHL00701.1 putative Nudix hydrolase 14, chloroplastic [Glarea lozoyensis 74030]EPE26910.1 Nudix [Glarea lozoyensis ATCC 20868]
MSSTKAEDVLITIQCDNLKEEEVREWKHFKAWLERLKKNLSLQPDSIESYKLKSITVEHCTRFGKALGFVKFTALIQNGKGETLSGTIFMRGPSVGMLLILQLDDAQGDEGKYVVMTVQPRPAATSMNFVELPAGMLDNDTFKGAAAKEIKEETSLIIKEEELINMSELAIKATDASDIEEDLPRAMWPSAGGCDEQIQLFLHEQRISQEELDKLKGKLTGLRDEGEKIKLKLVKLEDLWWEGARDAKALCALALYENLKKAGQLDRV